MEYWSIIYPQSQNLHFQTRIIKLCLYSRNIYILYSEYFTIITENNKYVIPKAMYISKFYKWIQLNNNIETPMVNKMSSINVLNRYFICMIFVYT